MSFLYGPHYGFILVRQLSVHFALDNTMEISNHKETRPQTYTGKMNIKWNILSNWLAFTEPPSDKSKSNYYQCKRSVVNYEVNQNECERERDSWRQTVSLHYT